MRTHLLGLIATLALLAGSTSTYAQGAPSLCTNGIMLLDTIACDTLVDYDKTNQDTASVEWETVVGVVSGDTILFLHPGSIAVTGGGSEVDSIGTVELFDLLATASVRRAVENGYLYGDPCSPSNGVSVSIPVCVTRLGSGVFTSFLPIDQCVASERLVEHCVVGGVTNVSVVSTSGCVTCEVGEPTCSTGGGGSIN